MSEYTIDDAILALEAFDAKYKFAMEHLDASKTYNENELKIINAAMHPFVFTSDTGASMENFMASFMPILRKILSIVIRVLAGIIAVGSVMMLLKGGGGHGSRGGGGDSDSGGSSAKTSYNTHDDRRSYSAGGSKPKDGMELEYAEYLRRVHLICGEKAIYTCFYIDNPSRLSIDKIDKNDASKVARHFYDNEYGISILREFVKKTFCKHSSKALDNFNAAIKSNGYIDKTYAGVAHKFVSILESVSHVKTSGRYRSAGLETFFKAFKMDVLGSLENIAKQQESYIKDIMDTEKNFSFYSKAISDIESTVPLKKDSDDADSVKAVSSAANKLMHNCSFINSRLSSITDIAALMSAGFIGLNSDVLLSSLLMSPAYSVERSGIMDCEVTVNDTLVNKLPVLNSSLASTVKKYSDDLISKTSIRENYIEHAREAVLGYIQGRRTVHQMMDYYLRKYWAGVPTTGSDVFESAGIPAVRPVLIKTLVTLRAGGRSFQTFFDMSIGVREDLLGIPTSYNITLHRCDILYNHLNTYKKFKIDLYHIHEEAKAAGAIDGDNISRMILSVMGTGKLMDLYNAVDGYLSDTKKVADLASKAVGEFDTRVRNIAKNLEASAKEMDAVISGLAATKDDVARSTFFSLYARHMQPAVKTIASTAKLISAVKHAVTEQAKVTSYLLAEIS